MTRPLSQTLARKFWGGLALAVISAALLVQLGRVLLPYANDQREFIAEQLGNRLGLQVDIGRIDARWQGLKPQITISSMVWRNQQQDEVLRAESIYTQIDLLQSVFNWRLSWTDLSIHSLHVHLQQHENGKLSLRGLSPGEDSSMGSIDPLRLLLTRGKIDFSEIHAVIYNPAGDFDSWRIPNVVAENTASFHRLRASIQVNGKPQAQFVLEGQGDPDNRETFLASAYLKLDGLDVAAIAAQFAGAKWQAFKHRQKLDGLVISGEFWLGMVPGGYMELSGQAQGRGGKSPLPSEFNFDVSGDVAPGGDWQLNVQELQSSYHQVDVAPTLNLALSGGPDKGMVFNLAELDLQAWYGLAKSNAWIPAGRLQELFEDLNLHGQLKNIKVDLGQNPRQDFLLSANLEQVSAGAWKGAPAVTQVDGYVQSGARRGFVELDSQQGFSMHYTTIYKDPQKFDRAKGQVVWTLNPEDNAIYVNSGPLDLAQGETQARGYLHLYTPWQAKTEPTELTLFIGLRNEVATNHYKYVPFVVGKPLLNWLDQSIQGGKITEAGFIFRGGLDTQQGKSQSLQLAADIEAASLTFLPDWQPVKKLNARLVLDGRQMFSQVHSANIKGLELSRGQVSVVSLAKVPGNVIQITAKVRGRGQAGLDFLHQSPLRATIGNAMADWQLGGNIRADIDLQFPLSPGQLKGQRQRVAVALENNSLNMGSLKLPVQKLKGEINFDERRGLGSKKLSAQLWQRPLTIDIRSRGGATDILFKHQLKPESLALWLNSPELLMTAGELAYQGKIAIPSKASAKPVVLSINSNLQGLAINLPAPFGKSSRESTPFSLHLPIADKNVLELNYKQLNLLLEQTSNGVERIALALAEKAKLSQAPGFTIDGHIAQLDIQQWPRVFSDYDLAKQRLEQLKTSNNIIPLGSKGGALPLKIGVSVARLSMGKASIDEVEIKAVQQAKDWQLDLSSELLAGQLNYFSDGSPVNIALSYLHLPESPEVEAQLETELTDVSAEVKNTHQAMLLTEFDFSQVFAAVVQIDDLSLGKKQLGRWSFELKPIDQGLELHNIKGQLGDLRIAGLPRLSSNDEDGRSDTVQSGGKGDQAEVSKPADLPEAGAFLRWTRIAGQDNTEIEALISTSDINQLSKQWQVPSILESQSGRFELAMQWQSNPLDLDPESLTGSLGLKIKKGRFFQSTGGAGGAVLRLVSLFNFDTWVRRLRLDFSDLYKEGMVFDQVEGQINFAEQKLLIKDPIRVTTPSSKLQFAGTIDWQQESLDTRLVATLPVGNNITLATALLVNLPAAAGVYLVSKLFSDQVDKVASVSYSMTGSWDKPKVEFERLFDSKAAKKAGEKVTEPNAKSQPSQDASEVKPEPKAATPAGET